LRGGLREQEDAYGRLVLDHLEHGGQVEIVERDNGFVAASRLGPEAYFAPLRQWAKHERTAIRLARGRVLDIGCGAGRVALHLQNRGHEVVGIDVSPLAVDVARRRGTTDVRVLSVTRVGPRLGRFDTFVMYGSNFGLVAGRRRAPWLLRRFRSIANEGARILAGSTNPYTTDNPDHLAYHERNRQRGRMGGQLRIRIRHGSYGTPWFDYLLASPDEMAELAAGTGWELTRVIDDGEPFYVGVLERAV
jgi:SAM-dependent methyltransferase